MTVRVEGLVEGEKVKMFAKYEIGEVFLNSPGGFAIGGKWASKNKRFQGKGEVITDFAVTGATPAVVGVSIFDRDGNLVDKVAYVLSFNTVIGSTKLRYNASYGRAAIGVTVNGDFSSGIYHGVTHMPVDEEAPVFNYAAIRQDQKKDPFYWAAAFIWANKVGVMNAGDNPEFATYKPDKPKDKNIEDVKGAAAEVFGENKEYQVKDYVNDVKSIDTFDFPVRTISLPRNIRSIATTPSGVEVLIYQDKDSGISIGLADALLVAEGEVSEDLLNFMEEQAKLLEALAQSIRIIAIARSGAQKSKQERKDKKTT